jgi:hypothetical protein
METVDILLRMQRHPLLIVPPEQEVFMKEFEKPIQVTVRAVSKTDMELMEIAGSNEIFGTDEAACD